MRVRPTADVSDWLKSVAEVLPLPHRARLPYTLGEAVAELGAYARAVGDRDWESSHSRKARRSLWKEIDEQSEPLGIRSAELHLPLVAELRGTIKPTMVAQLAAKFDDVWHGQLAVVEAFRDLCDAAKVRTATSRELNRLSSIIASQIGPAAEGAFPLLRIAADALVALEDDHSQWRGAPVPWPLTESDRVERAERVLVTGQNGQVVVWAVYYRALVMNMRLEMGPITFLRADWALPNSADEGRQDFPERAELGDMRESVPWLDELDHAANNLENRLVLVRVDLGNRQLAGSVEEAERRIEAVLSIAVEAGGVSWRNAGAHAILLDGTVRASSHGVVLQEDTPPSHSYGMGTTAERLADLSQQLGQALAKRPMPDSLIEALAALREARMTDHRDVLFFGTRRVTPRVATALEDHAMELIASAMRVTSENLAMALERREALRLTSRRVACQLAAPFNSGLLQEDSERRRLLEREVVSNSRGRPAVSIARAVALESEIRALPLSQLQRADFDEALAICTDPVRERRALEEMRREALLLRSRHRRVRNAVNHGLPLSEPALNSIRDYAEETSHSALNMALSWFTGDTAADALVKQAENAWDDRMGRIDSGMGWAEDEARPEENS